MNSRQYAAIRYRRNRQEKALVAEHVRATEGAALALGLCPGCGADLVAKRPHDTNCEVAS